MRRASTGIAAAAAVLALAACSQNGGSGAPAPSTLAPPPAVTSVSPTPATPSPPTTPPPRSTVPPRTGLPPAPPSCPTVNWGTGAKEAPGSSTDALYLVRVGRHDCYDRVVFTINGTTKAGYSVRYVPLVTADASGQPLPVPGGAVLQVVIRAPGQGADPSGHQPGRVLAATGDFLYPSARLASWPSLRAVRFAGSFEGQCTFAVGTRAKLPFRVLALSDPVNRVERIALDLAH